MSLRSRSPTNPSRSKRSWLALIVALVVLSGAAWRAWRLSTPLDELVNRARRALADQEFGEVETFCRRVLDRDPQSAAALLLAGEAAAKQGRLDDAVDYYRRVSGEHPAEAAVARLAAGDLLLHADRAAAAEKELRECLIYQPHQPHAHERLAWLLGVEGRRFESLPHLYELLRLNRFTVESLMAAGNHNVAFDEGPRLRAFRVAEPGNLLPLIGLARIELRAHSQQARGLLEQVLAVMPEQLEAQALLGRTLWEERDREALGRWLRQIPAAADEHPDVWLVRGYLAKEAAEPRAAARCFWEALRRDANHQAATYQLSQVLQSFGEADDVRFLAQRVGQLEELGETLDLLHSGPHVLELLRRAASLTEALGRLWEAFAWHQVARSQSPGSEAEWVIEGIERIVAQLPSCPGDTLASSDPGQRLDLTGYPLPTSTRVIAGNSRRAPDDDHLRSPTFRDKATDAGIDFTYFRGCEAEHGDGRMFEFTGGGVAVLDFDLDGWPDLYFTQGCRWPPREGQAEFLDQCYRNLGDGRFAQATAEARLAEDRFSQGATVGDFNGDGFPDLYVANIGVNRLLMNCGDGTFTDVTSQAGPTDASWTTSCLLADLNGDGLPDIYDVNYVTGKDVFERVCDRGGKPRTCPPGMFSPQADRLWLNVGDGRFVERSEASGIAVSGGNGLGIVAADFDNSGHLSLFVANDQDANFYFVNQGAVRDGSPRFTEMGVLSGLAFDGQGKAQACMGVAAGDANADGKLDLFVTNFYQESNTLYLQQTSDLFDDATAEAGLQAPSFGMLGFGTQFIDGELDGLPDLVVTNGHVDDFRHQGTPYQMRPQYFRNLGAGRFADVDAQRLGPFFEQMHIGRGLARIDWNRDGREDFVVSHLDEPVALLTNATEHAGHYLALRFHGTHSSRDAIGTRVTVSAGGNVWTQQLTAGDGYQASNQRQLVFGLATAESVDELVVHWPSSIEQVFDSIPGDAELIVVEGRDELIPLPR